ncbi:MAG: rod shape-determining protein [Candidatus Nanopelagicales bacterium]|jgi:rod shape-determining protein MreB|nr:rod shape-determining protein [Candidatus Nanopelagicales bacterium]
MAQPSRRSFAGRDLAIDLGTATTLVYVRGAGIVLAEPSIVAVAADSGALVGVGSEAKAMLGRTPEHIVTVRPLRDGVIADFDNAERMLRYFVGRVHRRSFWSRPRIVVAVPSGITGVERRAVRDACYAAGAREVHLMEEPMAAAIGAGLPVHEPSGSMVVDVGGGTTEVAVLALGGTVTSTSVRTGGDRLDEAIIAYAKKEYSLLIGERTAEDVKVAIGSAFPAAQEPGAQLRGRDLVTGLPRIVEVTAEEIRWALDEPVQAIVDVVAATLDRTPPELAGDVLARGIALTGGGALLAGLDRRLASETGMPVHVAERPLEAVALGVGRAVESFDALARVLLPEPRH